jgi:hypothetical protein
MRVGKDSYLSRREENAMKTFIEKDCTIEHEGRKFEAGGAVVTSDFLIAYPKENGVLGDWHGNAIGTWRVLSSWKIRSFYADRMYSLEARVNGVRYVGRGMGVGMSLKAKRSPLQA